MIYDSCMHRHSTIMVAYDWEACETKIHGMTFLHAKHMHVSVGDLLKGKVCTIEGVARLYLEDDGVTKTIICRDI